MEPKHLFTIRWTQPYPQYNNQYFKDLYKAYEDLVEESIDAGCLTEANNVIDRIKSL